MKFERGPSVAKHVPDLMKLSESSESCLENKLTRARTFSAMAKKGICASDRMTAE